MHDETHTHHHGVCFDFHFNNLQAEDPLLSVRLSSVRDFSESPLFFGFSSVLNFFFISGVTPIRVEGALHNLVDGTRDVGWNL